MLAQGETPLSKKLESLFLNPFQNFHFQRNLQDQDQNGYSLHFLSTKLFSFLYLYVNLTMQHLPFVLKTQKSKI